MRHFRMILIGFLALISGLLVTNVAVHLAVSATDEAHAQTTPTPLFSVQEIGPFNVFPNSSTSIAGIATVVTNNSNLKSSINVYFPCVPGSSLGKFGPGTCPANGIFVSTQEICEGPASDQTCD
jgi:hypothetical protein